MNRAPCLCFHENSQRLAFTNALHAAFTATAVAGMTMLHLSLHFWTAWMFSLRLRVDAAGICQRVMVITQRYANNKTRIGVRRNVE